MIRIALTGAGLAAVFGLAVAARLLDAVRLELEYRMTGEEPHKTTPPPKPSALEQVGGRHDGGASGRWGA